MGRGSCGAGGGYRGGPDCGPARPLRRSGPTPTSAWPSSTSFTTGRWCGWPRCWYPTSLPRNASCRTRSPPCIRPGRAIGTGRTPAPRLACCGGWWSTGPVRCRPAASRGFRLGVSGVGAARPAARGPGAAILRRPAGEPGRGGDRPQRGTPSAVRSRWRSRRCERSCPRPTEDREPRPPGAAAPGRAPAGRTRPRRLGAPWCAAT